MRGTWLRLAVVGVAVSALGCRATRDFLHAPLDEATFHDRSLTRVYPASLAAMEPTIRRALVTLKLEELSMWNGDNSLLLKPIAEKDKETADTPRRTETIVPDTTKDYTFDATCVTERGRERVRVRATREGDWSKVAVFIGRAKTCDQARCNDLLDRIAMELANPSEPAAKPKITPVKA